MREREISIASMDQCIQSHRNDSISSLAFTVLASAKLSQDIPNHATLCMYISSEVSRQFLNLASTVRLMSIKLCHAMSEVYLIPALLSYILLFGFLGRISSRRIPPIIVSFLIASCSTRCIHGYHNLAHPLTHSSQLIIPE
jgi:hypothetical protein